MNQHTRLTILAALSVSLAGVANSYSQSDGTRKAPSAQSGVRPGVDFRSARWLDDREIYNNNGENIAEVSDLILERGSGRIAYLVVKTGTHLGMGGKTVAIPYTAFRWDGKDENYLLASTTDELKGFPEFSAKNWSAMMESKDIDRNDLYRSLTADSSSSSDPYVGNLDTSKRERIEGEITKVERDRVGLFGEQVVITVLDSKGASRRVALGPSWYINGSSVVPMRGNKVTVETFRQTRDPEIAVGSTLRADKRELRLRGNDGSPAWIVEVIEADGRSYPSPHWRYLLSSTLRGMKLDCRGAACGKVNDVIVDRRSGEIGFLSIDPDQNYLGIADTKRLVPWTVATIGLDGTTRIDADKDMVVASPETPSDLSKLNDSSVSSMVYNAYKVSPPRFEPPKPTSPEPVVPKNPWSSKGEILSSMDSKTVALSGEVTDIDETTFDPGIQPAKTVTIKMGDRQETVLLGPGWYIDRQKLQFKSGDHVNIQASRAKINGKPVLIARTVEANGAKLVLIDSGGPAWDQR